MRISGGDLRRRRVAALRGSAMRPTSAKVREALFAIIGPRIVDANVLDLYAGSGAVGFEALSRGAAHTTFVELHAPAATAIKRSALALGVAARSSIVCAPAERASQRLSGPYDVVFADPPYAAPPPHLTFGTLRARGAIGPQTLLIYERREGAPAFASPGFATTREAQYGETILQFLSVEA